MVTIPSQAYRALYLVGFLLQIHLVDLEIVLEYGKQNFAINRQGHAPKFVIALAREAGMKRRAADAFGRSVRTSVPE
jgi:hypothetical protein